MKSQNQIIILILLYFINIIKIQGDGNGKEQPPVKGEVYPGIDCGKENPKKEKDCTKYGTDSGMLCCYVKNDNGTNFCTLLNKKVAEEKFKIDGALKIGDQNWSCGNKSFNLCLNLALFLILIFFII